MKRIILSVCALIAAFSVQCFAEVRISYDTAESLVKISVSGIKSQPALISVIKGAYDAELSPSEREYVLVKELYSDGSVECEIPNGQPSGEYTVITSVDGEQELGTVWYMNTELADDTLKKLAAATTADKVAEIIEANADNLAVDKDEFLEYKETVSGKFLTLFSGTDKKAADFQSAYYSALALAKANADSDNTEKYVRTYAGELGIDLDELDSLSSAAKTEFLRLFALGGINQKTPTDQSKEYIFLAKFNTEKSWTVCRDMVINEYKDFLKVNLTKYNNSNNKETAIKKIMNKVPYTSAASVVKDFEAALDSDTSSGGGSGGSSGSSGGSGGSGGASAGGYVSTDTKPKNVTFDDVPEGHWAYTYIKTLCASGVVKGVDETHFCPENGITRAEFATLIRAMFYKNILAVNADFADVQTDDWYYEPICVLNGRGIMLGDENGFFNPNSKITRQDVCVMLQRVLNLSDGEANFDDRGEIGDYAIGAVGSLYSNGVISGRGNNIFAPRETMTRAEAAAILCRASERSRG